MNSEEVLNKLVELHNNTVKKLFRNKNKVREQEETIKRLKNEQLERGQG